MYCCFSMADNVLLLFNGNSGLSSATQCYFIRTLPCFMWGISLWRIDGQSLKLITHCHLLLRLESGLHSLVLNCSYRITATLSLVKQFDNFVMARVNVQNNLKCSSAFILQWTQVYFLHAWHSARLINEQIVYSSNTSDLYSRIVGSNLDRM